MSHLRVMLVKDKYESLEDVVVRNEQDELPLQAEVLDGLPFEAAVFLRPPNQSPPAWQAMLEQGLKNPLAYMTSVAGALLLLRSQGRIFAIPFGYGRLLLKQGVTVPDFGVRVALNAIKPDKVRAVDMRTVEEVTIHTRRLLSRAGEFDQFGLDESRDYLRRIAGTADVEDWGRIDGANAVGLTVDVDFLGLPACCERLLEFYLSNDYVDRGFGFFDNLRVIDDKELLETLDSMLADALTDGDTSRMHMAPPDAVDTSDIYAYKYRGRGDAHDDPDIDELMQELSAADIVATPEWLKNHALRLSYMNSPEAFHDACALYDCVVYETRIEDDPGAVYILSAGDWHRVSDEYVKEVDDGLAAISTSAIQLPVCQGNPSEGDYNLLAAGVLDCACMDQKNVYLGANEKLELCDLLTRDRQFVHVKKRSKSSALSHLFMQGLNSARLFLENPAFRAIARDTVVGVREDHAEVITGETPNTADYEVVFAVIAPEDKAVPEGLPFFSRLSLFEVASVLQSMGFKVSTAHIVQTEN